MVNKVSNRLILKLQKDVEFLKSLHLEECNKREQDEILKRQEQIKRIEQQKTDEELKRFQEQERIKYEKLKEENELKLKQENERKLNEELRKMQEENERKLKEVEELKLKEQEELDKTQEISCESQDPPVDAEICGTIECEYSEIINDNESEETLYDEIEKELEDVQPNEETQKRVLELCGSISFDEVLCDKCEKIKQEYIDNCKKEGITEIAPNYFSMSCKPCQKARFNSWKKKKKAEKELDKANNKNLELKSKVKYANKKLELKDKLEKIDEEFKEGKHDRIIDKLEKINKGGNAKVNLNIYVNKNMKN